MARAATAVSKAKPKKVAPSLATSKQFIYKHFGRNPPSMIDGLREVMSWYYEVSKVENSTTYFDAVVTYCINRGFMKVLPILSELKTVIKDRFTYIDWALADQYNSGSDVPPDQIKRLDSRILENINLSIKQKSEETENLKIVPKTARAPADIKYNRIIEDLEEIIDNQIFYISNMKKPQFDYSLYATEEKIDVALQSRIVEKYKRYLQEYVELQSGKNEDLNESYAHYNKTQVKALIALHKSIVEWSPPKVKRVASTTTTVKKTTTKRATATKKKTATKIKSPFGANTKIAVFYYPTQKQVCVFYAAEGSALVLDGVTVKNFDINKSYMKSFGKQQTQLPALKKMTIDKVIVFCDSVVTVEKNASSRYKEDAEIIGLK